MNETQSTLFPSPINSQEHLDSAREIIRTIEDRIGYSNGLIKTGFNSDSLNTADNSLLAFAKYFLGEVDEARRIIRSIEEQIGYTDGLIKIGVCSQQESVSEQKASYYARLSSKSNIYFALALSILGESQKAKDIFSNVEKRAICDDGRIYQKLDTNQSTFGSELYLFPDVYLVLAEYFTGDITKAKTLLRKVEEYLIMRTELGFNREPKTLTELTKESAKGMGSGSPFNEAIITVIKYMKGDKIGAERLLQKIIKDYSEDCWITANSIHNLWVRDEDRHIYRTNDNLAVAIAHLAQSGVMDEYFDRITQIIRKEKQRQVEDKKESILPKNERRALKWVRLEMETGTLFSNLFSKVKDVHKSTHSELEEYTKITGRVLFYCLHYAAMHGSSAATSFANYFRDLRKDREELYREGVIAQYVEKDLERAIICYQRSGYLSHAAIVADKLTTRFMENISIACGQHTSKIKRLYRLMRSAYKSADQEDKVIWIDHLMGRRRGTQQVENRVGQWTDSARRLEQQAETLKQGTQDKTAERQTQSLLRDASELYLKADNHQRAAELLVSIGDLKRASAIYEKNRDFEDAAKLQEQMGNTQRAEELFEKAFLEYELLAKALGRSGTGIIMFGSIGVYRLASQRLANERGWDENRITQIYARNNFLE